MGNNCKKKYNISFLKDPLLLLRKYLNSWELIALDLIKIPIKNILGH
jgi:hypothetical protein